MRVEFVEVTLNGWEKYNYRPDVKRASWFRMDHGIFEDPDLFSLDSSEMAAFVYLLCQASRKNSGTILVNLKHVSAIARIPEKKMISAIDKLRNADVLARNVDVTCAGATDRQDKQTDKQTIHTGGETARVSPLVDLWNRLAHKDLPRVRGCGKSRSDALKARWREHPDEQYWTEVIAKINASPFCLGENKNGWKATFDFFVRPETHLKALEGTYDKASLKTHGDKWREEFVGQ
jgi:hypothetical protein